MQGTFTISSQDFTEDLFNKIAALVKGQNVDVTIRIKQKETPSEVRKRIDEAIEDIENERNIVAFSEEEFNQLTKKLSKV